MTRTTQFIPILLINTSDRLCKADPDVVAAMARSIDERGQRQPIEVVEYPDTDGGQPKYRLTAGLHRIEACTLLGRSEIEAFVTPEAEYTSTHEQRLEEITENLVRRKLSALERARNLMAWKESWLALYPERGRGKASKLSQNDITDTMSSFAEVASDALGVNERTIRRATRIVEKVDPSVLDDLALHPVADKQNELLALANEEPRTQRQICDLLMEGAAASVGQALDKIGGTVPGADDALWVKASNRFGKLPKQDRTRVYDAWKEEILAHFGLDDETA